MQIDDRFLSLPQFSRVTGLSLYSTREGVRLGHIPTVLIGRRRRISMRQIEAWLAGSRANVDDESLVGAR